MKYILSKILLITSVIVLASSCKKGWLDAKPKQSLTIPATLKDFQALLDNTKLYNADFSYLGELGSDDYYLTDITYDSRTELERNIYIWGGNNIFQGQIVRDWGKYYQSVFYANNVLEGLGKIEITANNEQIWKNLKGTALFYRAHAFLELAQLFSRTYNESTANLDMGIPLRLESDINIPSVRANMQDTYQQILSDLLAAKDLTPPTSQYKTRPTKPAVFALLSRVYLLMDDFDNALKYSDSCLLNFNTLLDYATLPKNSATPFPLFSNNPEIIFHSRMNHNSMLAKFSSGNGIVDTTLFKSYDLNDYRRDYFFENLSGRQVFTGNYDGGSSLFLFTGLATDEIYLIRAECYARKNKVEAAMQDLNTLLIKRWKGTYTPLTALDSHDALVKVLSERRKELCFRGIRWADLKRLNKDNNLSKELSRILNGKTYTLSPNDNRYIYPIPDDEILYNNLPQNPR